MKKNVENMKSCLQPAPKILVSCRDGNGNVDFSKLELL